jgi:uncharacterized protein (TIGR02594 family)
MTLPARYQWLNDIGPLPKMLDILLQYNGIKEVPGMKSNPIILEMAKGLGVDDIYTNDDTSWCAVFINHGIRLAGKPMVYYKGDKYNLLRAKWLLNWGEAVPLGDEKLGDIGVFDRPGGGHVAIIIAETKSTFVIYGGNQANSAGFTEIVKSRLVGCRRYYSIAPPPSAKKYYVNSSGKLSTNEA